MSKLIQQGLWARLPRTAVNLATTSDSSLNLAVHQLRQSKDPASPGACRRHRVAQRVCEGVANCHCNLASANFLPNITAPFGKREQGPAIA